MFQFCGKRVIYLKRTSMGKLKLTDDLGLGQYRMLTTDEQGDLLENLPQFINGRND
jgi:16S rRNA pseudouridine516 synthase